MRNGKIDQTLMIMIEISGMLKNPKIGSVFPRKLIGLSIHPSCISNPLIGLKVSLSNNCQIAEVTSGGVTHGAKNIARKKVRPRNFLFNSFATSIAKTAPKAKDKTANTRVFKIVCHVCGSDNALM